MTHRAAAKMVDISQKPILHRTATASGTLRLRRQTLQAIRSGTVEKGDVLEIARTAAILAAKNTPQILPLTHPIPLEGVALDLELQKDRLVATATVQAHWKTGVEMEALVATAAALLTVWDLVKPLEKDAEGQYPTTRLEDLRVLRKVKQA